MYWSCSTDTVCHGKLEECNGASGWLMIWPKPHHWGLTLETPRNKGKVERDFLCFVYLRGTKRKSNIMTILTLWFCYSQEVQGSSSLFNTFLFFLPSASHFWKEPKEGIKELNCSFFLCSSIQVDNGNDFYLIRQCKSLCVDDTMIGKHKGCVSNEGRKSRRKWVNEIFCQVLFLSISLAGNEGVKRKVGEILLWFFYIFLLSYLDRKLTFTCNAAQI